MRLSGALAAKKAVTTGPALAALLLRIRFELKCSCIYILIVPPALATCSIAVAEGGQVSTPDIGQRHPAFSPIKVSSTASPYGPPAFSSSLCSGMILSPLIVGIDEEVGARNARFA